jgi:hypothetical protein
MMTPEEFLPYTLAAIAGLALLAVVLRLKWRDERDRSERLRQELLRLQLQAFNERRRAKPYRTICGSEAE